MVSLERGRGTDDVKASRGSAALELLCLASFMAVVDTTIVSVALPSVQRDLGFSGADGQWILNGYVLSFGGLLLACGRAADLFGRRLVFLCGLGVFAAASLFGGFAPSPGALVAARVLQGVGAAAFVPASLSLLTAIHAKGEERRSKSDGAAITTPTPRWCTETTPASTTRFCSAPQHDRPEQHINHGAGGGWAGVLKFG